MWLGSLQEGCSYEVQNASQIVIGSEGVDRMECKFVSKVQIRSESSVFKDRV